MVSIILSEFFAGNININVASTLQGGIYLLTLMDWYIGTFPPLFVALFEVLIVAYVYGQ